MSILTSLFAICNANTALAALIGSGANMRLYPQNIPQDAPMPAAAYSIVGGAPANTFDPAAPADHLRITFDFNATDYDAAQAGAAAIRTAFEDIDALIAHGLGAQCVSLNPDDFNEDRELFIASIDMSFWQSR